MNEEIVLLLKEIRDLLIDFRQVLGAKQIVNILAKEEHDANDIEPKVVSPELAQAQVEKIVNMARIYTYMSKKGNPYTCKNCGGFISWELRPERSYPLHVNQEGKIVNDGNCPEYQP